MTRPHNRRKGSDVAGRHRAWLELVDREGPFLAVPALKRVWPQGIGHVSDAAKGALADAKPDFDRVWDEYTRATATAPGASEAALAEYRGARDKWVQTVLQDVAGWENLLTWDLATLPNPAGAAGVPVSTSPARRVQVQATGALRRGNDVGALILVVDPVGSLRDPGTDEWSASPIDRMDALLRDSGHLIGVVTDGRWWAIVSAQPDTMTASGIVDAQTWIEEPDVRNAFFALLDVQRFFGGETTNRLTALFRESVTAAEEITVALGTQVRRAVELVVTAFSESAADARTAGRPDPLPVNRGQVYDGAVTAMMRVVFLLFAEERSMMPQSVLFTSAYGVSDELDRLDARLQDEGAESLDATHHTWHRLLATSRALYSGVNTEDMRLPAYGGSLFDAERFPWLTVTDESGALALTVSDRVMLEVLRSVQYAPIGGESRRISFRDIGVEQIGYIYEGLLGYTSQEVDEVTVGLIGKDGEEPEISLDVLDDLWEQHDGDPTAAKALIDWVKKNQSAGTLQPNSASGLVRKLNATIEDADRALLSVTRDEALIARLRPYLGLIRRDLRNRPVVIQPGGLAVVETKSRANAGAHYTPKSLAHDVARHALEPLVYSPGPHQSADRSTWRPIDSNQILDLKVADIACGSGAFLVAAAEYLADRLVEAWRREGVVSQTSHDLLIKARRAIVASCLYGADINAMAVEMCKLSLWLVSLDPGQPFSFVDDKVLHGNSLLGLTDVKQIEEVHINPSRVKHQYTGSLLGIGGDVGFVETVDVRARVRALANLRRQIAGEIVENDVMRSANAKKRLWARYQADAAELTLVADGIIAAGLELGGKPGGALDEKYENLRIAVDRAFTSGGDHTMLNGIVEHGLTPTVETDYERWKPLHWALAVPDVFEHGGFDAIVGNPPFLGGKKISGASGSNVREWFVNVLAGGVKGNADLVAYFFLRATSLLSAKGMVGLIATNTVAQGDTREVGLDAMVAGGFTITRAVQSRPWPAQSANLEYAAVWGT
ncbi:Eco57I restriction-modification methylase domain-containing protein, partial [Promicromonospora sukumoe]|uniref:Eco57I restriction-modification methylase domain-containing protein n=1 Tax=Promicromonospora sukumoe TaxID=88382 RepID=UPI0005267734